MAAGLSILESDFARFKQVYTDAVANTLAEEDKHAVILTDGNLPADCFNLNFANQLKQAGPFGQSFVEPLFDDVFYVIQQRMVGEKHLKLVLRHASGLDVDAIAFNVDLRAWPNTAAEKVRLAYQLDINEFRGKFSLQLLVSEIQLA